MGQRVFFNFEDDDYTWDISRAKLGMNGMNPGLHAGFDFVPAAGMNLGLNHATTGGRSYDITSVIEARFGLAISRQGAIVKDDTVLNLAINTTAGNPRIDLIYMEHEYTATTGGTVATYGVVQGVAAATPVPPALVTPGKQIILGYLYLPAACTNLNQAGVFYRRYTAPFKFYGYLASKVVATTVTYELKADGFDIFTPNDGITRKYKITASVECQNAFASGEATLIVTAPSPGPGNLFIVRSKTDITAVSKTVVISIAPNTWITAQIYNNSVGSNVTFQDISMVIEEINY